MEQSIGKSLGTVPERSAWEPPGGVLVWIIVFLELLTFGAGLGVFLFTGSANEELFLQGRAALNQPLAFANTLVLLSGGWCMVNGLLALKNARSRQAFGWILGAAFSGVVFIVFKGFEYADKFEHGLVLGTDSFFTLYYLLTGFHLAHVLVAEIILCVMLWGIRRGRYDAENHFDVESSGIFWHMCDLIWLLVYPVIYLL